MKNLLAIYFFLKTSFSNENVLVLPEFLKNKGKFPKNIEFLRNEYFVKEKSSKNF
jgi:hypothetical protein